MGHEGLKALDNIAYRPYRLKVVKEDDYPHNRYWIVIWDEVEHRIVDEYVRVWSRGTRRGLMHFWKSQAEQDPDLPIGGFSYYGNNKREAEQEARTQAEALGLEYVASRDRLSRADVKKGPEQECLLCGGHAGRGWERAVCEDCRSTWGQGRATLAQGVLCLVGYTRLLSYSWTSRTHRGVDIRRESESLFYRLLKVAGLADLGRWDRWKDREPSEVTVQLDRRGDQDWLRKVRMTRHQAEGMQEIIEQIATLMEAAWNDGYNKGKSMLQGLASGEFTVEEWNKKAIGGD